MQHLKSIENSFELLGFKTKILLFLFPLLVLVFIYLYFFDIKTQSKVSNLKFVNISKLKMEKKLIDVLKDIETFAFENEIYLNNITKTDYSLDFIASSDLKTKLKLLIFLEKYNSFSKIKSFQINEENLKISLVFSKFYKKEEKDFTKQLEVFEEKRNELFTLKAIVGQKAFINDKWLNLNDKIERFTLKKVDKTTVVLENKFKKISLNLIKKNHHEF